MVAKELREAAKEAGITADRGEKLYTNKIKNKNSNSCYEEKELREAAKEAGITADRRKTKKPSTTPPKRAQAARTALRCAK